MGEDGAAAATGAGAAAGKEREGKGDSRAEEEGQFWLQEERKALCRRFSVARAL